MSTEGLFNEAVKGRYPLSEHISAAPTWFPTEGSGAYVPRPDKTLTGLRIASVLGLDHFYLRSPITGIFKLVLTGVMVGIGAGASGGSKIGALLVGIWYMWDLGQVFFEGDRVVKYGMTTPFDMQTGIGQGMITDDKTHYAQRKNFSISSFLTLFGFTGIDAAVMGKPALLLRKFVDFCAFAGFMYGVIASGAWTSPSAGNIAGLFFLMIFAVIFGAFVWVPWWAAVSSTVFNPRRMFAQGIKVDPDTLSFLNFFNMWVKDIGSNTTTRVNREFGYGNVEPEDLKADFGIEYRNDEVKKADAPASNDVFSTWPASLLLGNIFTGPLTKLYLAFDYPSKIGLEGAMMAAECARKLQLGKELGAGCNPVNLATTASGPLAGLTKIAGSSAAIERAAMVSRLLPTAGGGGAATAAATVLSGGARNEGSGISTEGKILGAVTVALIAGGALKGVIDSLIKE